MRSGTTQAAYQVLAASSSALLADGVGDLWDSGQVLSPDCVLVPYQGAPLTSRQQVFWSVRVWDEFGVRSPYAGVGSWEMGLLDAREWRAEWVCSPTSPTPSAVTYLRRDINIAAPVRRARAYVTALGLYELHCNGQRVGDARFTPGWTDYAQRVQYQVLDLTDLLVEGTNALGAVLVDGWYAGYVGFQGTRAHYGDAPTFLAQVEVDTDVGRTVHVTDGSWWAGSGALLSSDMLRGEAYDARLAGDWCRPGTPPASWQPVRITAGTPARRVTSPAPPVRVLDERQTPLVERVGPGTHRIDVGQNLVGWLRLQLDGAAGTQVTVRHAEVLQADGGLYVENLRTATATDTYVLSGEGARSFEPCFTFHGFRYAEVSGYEGDLGPGDVTVVVCGSDLELVGHFSCSDESVNQLHSNIVWGARGNFFDIPTDCPQRDERMGWTGDAQVFAPTACYLLDTAGFFTKWLRDLTDGQNAEGSFPDVAPRVLLGPEGSAGWADAGVVLSTVLWSAYADEELLAELYPAMRRWVDYVHRANPGLLWLAERGYDNGDWLCVGADTDNDLIATAYFALSARLTARAAEVLHREDEASELHLLADGICAAFQAEYLLPEGRLTSHTQTAYALALRFGLVPADQASAAAQHLVDDIEAHDTHLTTGFLGVGQLLPALSDAGRTDLAYRLLLQDSYPSWLHAVRAGATTVWE
ncbi:MAG: family 78 glycoside hydrolase catalytic domain, partial [Actinomycetota bacterium]|nr:family 78 glycoside hydrolase catalytic domain [Actinomycetota bacterium]